MSKYFELEKCIEERLHLLSTRLNLNPQDVEINYIQRKMNLFNSNDKVYYCQNYSKFSVKAYQGTVKHYEEQVK